MEVNEIKWEYRGTLENGQELITLFTVKLKKPVEEMSDEYFKLRSEILKDLTREVIRPSQVYALKNKE
jgi:hypothetical protein